MDESNPLARLQASNIVAAQKELTSEEKQMAIFYGDSFSGKTYAAARMALLYNVWWVDLEKGWRSIEKSLVDAGASDKLANINLIRLDEKLDSGTLAKDVYAMLKNNSFNYFPKAQRVNDVLAKKEEEPIKLSFHELTTKDVVIIDTMSALSDSAMAHYLGASAGEMMFKKKEFSHYDNQGLYLNNAIMAAQKLPCHVIFISHQEQIEQEDGTEKLTPTGGTRNFSRKIPRKFDHAVHFRIYNGKHKINSVTTNDPKVIAGSREGVDIQDIDDIPYLFSGKLPEKTKTASKSKLSMR